MKVELETILIAVVVKSKINKQGKKYSWGNHLLFFLLPQYHSFWVFFNYSPFINVIHLPNTRIYVLEFVTNFSCLGATDTIRLPQPKQF